MDDLLGAECGYYGPPLSTDRSDDVESCNDDSCRFVDDGADFPVPSPRGSNNWLGTSVPQRPGLVNSFTRPHRHGIDEDEADRRDDHPNSRNDRSRELEDGRADCRVVAPRGSNNWLGTSVPQHPGLVNSFARPHRHATDEDVADRRDDPNSRNDPLSCPTDVDDDSVNDLAPPPSVRHPCG